MIIKNLKSIFFSAILCVTISLCMSGCVNEKSNELFRKINITSNSNIKNITSVSRNIQSQVMPIKINKNNAHIKKNIIYIRKYDKIKKNSYMSSFYKIKQGDTLFYIAWITGKDYKDLAKKNKIPKPYILKINNVLKIKNTLTTSSCIFSTSNKENQNNRCNSNQNKKLIGNLIYNKISMMQNSLNNKQAFYYKNLEENIKKKN